MDWLLAILFRMKWRGVGRLSWLLKGGHVLPSIRTATIHGLSYLADPYSYVDISILRTGYFEPELLDLMLSELQIGDIFWDVGANTGIHSLTIKHLRPDVRVISIEPSPLTFTRLYRNAKVNSISVDLWCIALSNRRGFAHLSIVDRGNTGLNSFRPWKDIDYASSLPVWCETGDNLVESQSAPAPNVIKVDVEQFELEVFQGMSTLLSMNSLRCIFFEGREDLLDLPSSYPLSELLKSYGFSIRGIPGGRLDYIAIRELEVNVEPIH